jgi:hypothetical protein
MSGFGEATGLYEQQMPSVLRYLNEEMTAKAEIRCAGVLGSPALGMPGTLAPLAFTSWPSHLANHDYLKGEPPQSLLHPTSKFHVQPFTMALGD